MNPKEWAELKALFDKAIELSETDRPGFLAQVHARDAGLGDRLAALVAAHFEETRSKEPGVHARPLSDRLFSDGEIVLGRFEIVRLLGAGGMGEVYEANDREMGRIALKTVRGGIYSSEHLLTRLKQEVSIARQIANPHVCRLYEFFPIPPESGRRGFACFTMEFLEGLTVSNRIKQNGAFAWPDAKQFAMQICDGLTAIHQAGVIHRDLKSNNIMLAERRGALEAVVMDFGLARRAQAVAAAANSGLTQQGAVMGTPGYMAPEQFECGEVSPATDIYAFGVVLYEMLAGKHPFEASSPIAAAVQRAKRLESVSSIGLDIPHYVDNVIERCLEYEASRRYQTAAEVGRALTSQPLPVQAPKPASRLSIRRPLGIASLCLVIAALLAGLFIVVSKRSTSRISPDALHWYSKGLASLREGSYLAATSALQTAIAHDNNFALAHARLAEAWSELDFTGRAEHELVLASSPEAASSLDSLDKKYVEAIRRFISEDFAGAIAEYQLILEDLPALEKAAGYLDLGRAQEKLQDIPGALKNYAQAALIPPESPAPFLRRAILEGRENDLDAAARDFSKAESLYRSAQNYEGLAEITFQRGYIATLQSRLPEARILIEKSLQTAREMSNAQLEIRALTRLAVISYGEGNDDEAIRLGNQAIEIAHDKDLDYWAIDARIRVANAYRDRGDLAKADLELRQALDLARQNRRPRLMALASYSLASLRNQQDNPGDTIPYATAALSYYQKEHFVNESLSCSMLINRARLQRCEFSEALRGGLETLALARKTNNPATIYPIEEFVGSAKLKLQDYPAALEHFQAALAASSDAGQQVEYQLAHCADALWRLGRYKEAENALVSMSAKEAAKPRLANLKAVILAKIRLSQLDYAGAVRSANQASQTASTLLLGEKVEAQLLLVQAYSQLGQRMPAQEAFAFARENIHKLDDPELLSNFNYVSALMSMKFHQFADAKSAALSALQFASASNQPESSWKALSVLAAASVKLGDPNTARDFAQKGLDILDGFEHNWSSQNSQGYLQRPDVQDERSKLSSLVRRRRGRE